MCRCLQPVSSCRLYNPQVSFSFFSLERRSSTPFHHLAPSLFWQFIRQEKKEQWGKRAGAGEHRKEAAESILPDGIQSLLKRRMSQETPNSCIMYVNEISWPMTGSTKMNPTEGMCSVDPCEWRPLIINNTIKKKKLKKKSNMLL